LSSFGDARGTHVPMYSGTQVPQGLSCEWGPVFSLEDC
jgi:hypothetical protein